MGLPALRTAVLSVGLCLCSSAASADGPRARSRVAEAPHNGREITYSKVREYLEKELDARPEDFDLGLKITLRMRQLKLTALLKNLENGDELTPEQKAALKDIYAELYSELSADYLAKLAVGFTRTVSMANVLIIGEPGVGKSHLVRQLAWMYTHNILPDYLRTQLNMDDPSKPAGQFAADFLGKTNVVMINKSLLGSNRKRKDGNPWGKPEERMAVVLKELFHTAEVEYNEGRGNRTIFVIEEAGTMPGFVYEELKTIAERSYHLQRGRTSITKVDPGYRIALVTTNNEWRKLVGDDSAIERRYSGAVIQVQEPSDAEVFKLARDLADRELTPNNHGIRVEDAAIDYLIQNKNHLNWPPLPNPFSTLAALDRALGHKMEHSGTNPMKLTRADVASQLRGSTGLTELWFPGPNGEPLMHGLADKVKTMVVGHDDVIDRIANRISTWVRFGVGESPPVFFLGGPSGSGKDTIVMAFNMALFGHPGTDLMFDLAGKEGFGIEAILTGPPKGNHSDKQQSLLMEALDKWRGKGIIAFNEVYDMTDFEKFKVLVEQGVIRPSGIDSRVRPILYPIFFMGQFGERLFMDENGRINPDLDVGELTDEIIERAFTQGRMVNGVLTGAVSPALIMRAQKMGGLELLRPLPTSRYHEVVELWLGIMKQKLNSAYNINIEVDASLVQLMVRRALASDLQVRALGGIMTDLTKGAISKASEQGLPVENLEVQLSASSDGKSVVVSSPSLPEQKEYRVDRLVRFSGASRCASTMAGK